MLITSLISIGLGLLTVAPLEARPADDAALDFARVYLGGSLPSAIGQQLHSSVAYCLSTKQIDAERARVADERVDRYAAELAKIFPDLQTAFADVIRPGFSPDEMQQAATFIKTSAAQVFLESVRAGMGQSFMNSSKFCQNGAPQPDLEASFSTAIGKLSPAERQVFRNFALSPAAKKFGLLAPAVQTVGARYQAAFNAAGVRSGLTESMLK